MANFDLTEMLFSDSPCMINVLDVGAIGIKGKDAPYDKLVRHGRARIIGFEPDAAGCDKLNQKYGHPHRFFPYFIGDGQSATFYETNWPLTGSLFKPNRTLLEKFQNLHELTVLKAEHPVATRRLDDIVELGEIDFIKIDVQGAELSIFQGGINVLQNALLVQTEVEFVELYEKQPLFADVDQFLCAQGYKFHTFDRFGKRCFKPIIMHNNINLGLRQLLWSDAIYVRDWMRFDTLPIEKLKKMAVLLHDVVASYDLCHLALRSIDERSGTAFSPRYVKALLTPGQVM